MVLLFGCIVLPALYCGSYVVLRQTDVLSEVRHPSPEDVSWSVECWYFGPPRSPEDETWRERGQACLTRLYQPLALFEIRVLRRRLFKPQMQI